MKTARLITETREALEQQTATAEVLQVINSSPGNLSPVFDAMLEKAMRLCGAAFGTLWRLDDGQICLAAQHNVPKAHAEFFAAEMPQPGPAGPLFCAFRGGSPGRPSHPAPGGGNSSRGP